MKISEIIAMVDRLKPNYHTADDKVKWLEDIDGMIVRELIDTHEDSPLNGPFEGYDADKDMAKELLVPAPYDVLYRYWLESQIDLANMELGKYNNSRNLFNAAYVTYTDHYNRTHMPRRKSGFSFTQR